VDKGYEVYCLADPSFYDSPRSARPDDGDFEVARRQVPEGWERVAFDDWLAYQPEGVQHRPQGWKIHVSTCLDNAEEILGAVWDYCIARRIAFKFVPGRLLLFLRNAKYADRAASGKFITIYPADDTQLEVVLTELGALLDGQSGPYILSDLRLGAGPLYVRYGGFQARFRVGSNGKREPAIEDPTGRLITDPRGTTFQIPPWVTLPDFLAPHLAARNRTTVADMPYRVEEALHFSNGGGLYAGVDQRTGERVVLKEARPHAGLARDGADAVARLRREREMLERLAGLNVVPAVREYFTLAEHHFLVLEFIEGATLQATAVRRNPLILEPYPSISQALNAEAAAAYESIDAEAAAEYASWTVDVCRRVERAIDALHGRGVVLGDVHPSNVLVGPDGRVVLIDLEIAADVSENRRQTMADAAFLAPRGLTGFDIDRYALACMRIFLFLPLTMLFGLDRAKAHQLATVIADLFPVPREFLAEAVRVIMGAKAPSGGPVRARGRSPTLDPDPTGWRRARDSMAAAIESSATPNRDDRLFPGDVSQFSTGGLNIAYGAAGVLYALAETGAGRYPQHEEWLVERAMTPRPEDGPGFYDGLHGVAYVLDRLDRRDDAIKLLDICRDTLDGKLDQLGLDLKSGLAGIGLNLAHFAEATGDPGLWNAAREVAELVADRLGDEESVPTLSGGEHPRAGLLRGSSGPALMFIRMHEQAGDAELLDLAATALRQDLRRCMLRDDGSLEVDEGWRTMPYIADGSVGIGLVLQDYLAHREDEQFAQAAAAIRTAAAGRFYVWPGLFSGRAGMILYLSRGLAPGTAGHDPLVAAHVRALAWQALTYRGQLAFPGDQLLRLSMDLATGTAGVMLALGAALHDEPVQLPFLGPVRAEHDPARAQRVAHSADRVLTAERR
jgi:serine/threonine protein kinase